MSFNFRPIEYFRTKFYQKEREFKGFNNIDNQMLLDLVNKVYQKQELAPSFNPYIPRPLSKTEVYQRVLEFLSAQNIHSIIKTWNERLAFLILSVDPNLDMLRIFEEDSLMTKVQERIKEEFGYYNQAMLRLERKNKERFYPELKLSPWSNLK